MSDADRLLARFSAPVPRYTSYPTAPHFHEGVTADTYRGWLAALPEGAKLSLYLHIPYCDRLCWFCACHTKQTHAYAPVSRYVAALIAEIAAVGRLVGAGKIVTAVHFGGGSPTLLSPFDMARLGGALRTAFDVADDAEISVEIDPNDMDEGRYAGLAALGMTRASLGVQDFNPVVQQAINREQSFEQTRAVVDGVRAHGARSVNIDILYGLPYQTSTSLAATIDEVLSLRPDRLALFGYAHVPWFKKHQTMIPEHVLPDQRMRLAQACEAAERIVAAGYRAIGLDHFALDADPMAAALASGTLSRNFQGYTVDDADALIGLGASSIGRLPQGYVQNMPATGRYEVVVAETGIAVARGIALSEDDRVRGFLIERLMCDFCVSPDLLRRRFGKAAEPVLSELERMAEADPDGVILAVEGGFRVSERAAPFVRSVAANFDAYLGRGAARHSAAI